LDYTARAMSCLWSRSPWSAHVHKTLRTATRVVDIKEVQRSHLADRIPPTPADIGEARTEPNPAVESTLRYGAFRLTVVSVALFVVYLLWQLTRVGGATHGTLIGDAFFLPADMLAIYSAVAASRRCHADRRRSWSWSFIAIGMIGYLIGDLLQLYNEGMRHLSDTPDWGDAVFYTFFFIGLVGFTTTRRNVVRRWLFTLDTTTIALSAGAVLWYFVTGPLATSQRHSIHAVVFAITYPLGDLVLLLAAVRTLQSGVPLSSQRSIRMIAAGIFAYVVADTMQGYLGLHGGYHGGDRIDIVGMTAAILFSLAGAMQPQVKAAHEATDPPSKRTGSSGMSYAAAAAVFALVFVIDRHERFFPDLFILGVAVLVATLVAVGQVLSRKALLGEQAKNEDLLGELRHQAFHDDLTGIANRALFRERLEHALDRRRSLSMKHAVLMIDLKDFKSVNDRFGHAAGDEVLRAVATRLGRALRRGDTVARVGGDEFAILLEDVNGVKSTVEIVDHLLGVLREPVSIGQQHVVPAARVGVVLTDEEPHTAEELLRYADNAMYQAKQQHDSHYCVFETAMQTALAERVELEADLRGAVGRGELRVYYQPIVDLASQDTIGFEALVRWMHPSRGLLPPAVFLPLAEQGGLIHEIDTWVLYEACSEASRWQHERPKFAEIGIHVNLSPLQLREPDLIDTITDALSVYGLEPRSLTLELLESSVVDDLELAQARLTDLKAIGVRIAVDDFGTGYSSLSHLRILPIDELKIDRSFIAAMRTSVQASTLVRSLIQLGAALGIDTVAEGIEEPEQLSRLQDESCLKGQGYLFSRPLDRDGLRSYLLDEAGVSSGTSRQRQQSRMVRDGA
jgi:diguanylate cyclase